MMNQQIVFCLISGTRLLLYKQCLMSAMVHHDISNIFLRSEALDLLGWLFFSKASCVSEGQCACYVIMFKYLHWCLLKGGVVFVD